MQLLDVWLEHYKACEEIRSLVTIEAKNCVDRFISPLNRDIVTGHKVAKDLLCNGLRDCDMIINVNPQAFQIFCAK